MASSYILQKENERIYFRNPTPQYLIYTAFSFSELSFLATCHVVNFVAKREMHFPKKFNHPMEDHTESKNTQERTFSTSQISLGRLAVGTTASWIRRGMKRGDFRSSEQQPPY
jgi:hypothetical protein